MRFGMEIISSKFPLMFCLGAVRRGQIMTKCALTRRARGAVGHPDGAPAPTTVQHESQGHCLHEHAKGDRPRTASAYPLGTSSRGQLIVYARRLHRDPNGSLGAIVRLGFGFRARLGATRDGSPGIFGYCGGHGASTCPAAISRS